MIAPESLSILPVRSMLTSYLPFVDGINEFALRLKNTSWAAAHPLYAFSPLLIAFLRSGRIKIANTPPMDAVMSCGIENMLEMTAACG